MFIITQNNNYNFYNIRFFATSFDQKIMLFKNDCYNDYYNINYQTFFNDHHFIFQLNYAKLK